jgi:hypothetical protein
MMAAGQAPPAVVTHYVRQHVGPVTTYSAHRAPNGDWYLSIRPLASRTAYLLKVCVRGNRPHGLANISNGEPDCD